MTITVNTHYVDLVVIVFTAQFVVVSNASHHGHQMTTGDRYLQRTYISQCFDRKKLGLQINRS